MFVQPLPLGFPCILPAVLLAVGTGAAVAQEYNLYAEAPFHVLAYDAAPVSGNLGQPMSIAACPGEYEPATFSIHAQQALSDLTVTAGPLQNGSDTIASDQIDIRVVKFWYQGGQWRSSGRWSWCPSSCSRMTA